MTAELFSPQKCMRPFYHGFLDFRLELDRHKRGCWIEVWGDARIIQIDLTRMRSNMDQTAAVEGCRRRRKGGGGGGGGEKFLAVLPDEFVDKTVSEMVADDLPQLLALRGQPFWAPASGVDRKRGGADVFSRAYGRWDKVARWQELSGSASSRLQQSAMAKGSSLLRLLMVISSVFACLYTAGRYVLSCFLLHTSEILRSVNSLS